MDCLDLGSIWSHKCKEIWVVIKQVKARHSAGLSRRKTEVLRKVKDLREDAAAEWLALKMWHDIFRWVKGQWQSWEVLLLEFPVFFHFEKNVENAESRKEQ